MHSDSTTIELVSGRKLDLANPDPAVINLEVIAYHLSNVCRYAGATDYSVASHTLVVSRYLEAYGESVSVILSGLHHDDPEFAIGDITKPMKNLIGPRINEIEHVMWTACGEALGYSPLHIVKDSRVKTADNWTMAAEALHLMRSQGKDWWSKDLYNHYDKKEWKIAREIPRLRVASGASVRLEWLLRHQELVRRLERAA